MGKNDETRLKTGFVENAACISTGKQYTFSDMNKNGTAEKIRKRIAAAQEGALFVMGISRISRDGMFTALKEYHRGLIK